jgi:D-alanyl-D-alanine carboxypeptidase/D-alanyl-D-alanine-endopeptidase (penicillin-binding protein 4)
MKRHGAQFSWTCAAVLLNIALCVLPGCSTAPALSPENPPVAVSTPDARNTPPRATDNTRVETSEAARDLQREIDTLIDSSPMAKARWGVYIMSDDGRVLYSRNGSQTFTPASNMKVYTTAIALDLLGPDYRWRTSVYAGSTPDQSGTIKGDITLYGRGAPDLTSPEMGGNSSSLSQLADALYSRGIRHITGNVIADESYFKGEELGDGWQWNDLQWYYGAQPSALTIDDNEVRVTVGPAGEKGVPANIKLDRHADYFHVTNDSITADRSEPATVGIERGLSNNQLRVWGSYPLGGREITARIAIYQPARLAGILFLRTLRAKGILVDGDVRLRDYRSNDANTPTDRRVALASIESRPLGEIVKETNKESVNLSAEIIFRTLGHERGATVPDPNPKKMAMRSDSDAGAAVERKWLSDHSIDGDSVLLRDGSGLSRLNVVTPEATTRLLKSMSATPEAAIFHDSLPEAGRDGTLRRRLSGETEGLVFAKTGTLTAINSLSGYAHTSDGRTLIFSIFCNEETASSAATPVIDSIIRTLLKYRPSEH